jgi:molybdopterin converting factor small subunit
MSEAQSEIRHPKSDIGHVTVEVVAWVTQFVGGDGTRRKIFDELVAPDTTVGDILRRVSHRHPKLQQVLWERPGGDLGEHIEVLVNNAALGVTHTLDSPVRDGDRITLLGQYTGG